MMTGRCYRVFVLSVAVFAVLSGGVAMALELKSPAFGEKGSIPRKYTCEGQDLSPPLVWSGVPSLAKTLAIICDDPDAPMGTWVHWVIYNIPADSPGLEEGVPAKQELENGSRQGVNDFPRIGYGGPCPPPGMPHRYFFKLYALDAPLSLKGRVTKEDLLQALKGHVVAQAELVGLYRR